MSLDFIEVASEYEGGGMGGIGGRNISISWLRGELFPSVKANCWREGATCGGIYPLGAMPCPIGFQNWLTTGVHCGGTIMPLEFCDAMRLCCGGKKRINSIISTGFAPWSCILLGCWKVICASCAFFRSLFRNFFAAFLCRFSPCATLSSWLPLRFNEGSPMYM